MKELLKRFKEHHITQKIRAENSNANSLAKLASANESKLVSTFPMETLRWPNIFEKEKKVNPIKTRLG